MHWWQHCNWPHRAEAQSKGGRRGSRPRSIARLVENLRMTEPNSPKSWTKLTIRMTPKHEQLRQPPKKYPKIAAIDYWSSIPFFTTILLCYSRGVTEALSTHPSSQAALLTGADGRVEAVHIRPQLHCLDALQQLQGFLRPHAAQQGVVADHVGGQADPGQVLGHGGHLLGEDAFLGTSFSAKLVVFEMEKLILAKNGGVKLRKKWGWSPAIVGIWMYWAVRMLQIYWVFHGFSIPVSLPSIKANPSLFKEQARLLPKVAPGTGRDPSIPVLKIQDFWALPQQDLQHPKGKVSAVLFGEDVQQLPSRWHEISKIKIESKRHHNNNKKN